ncbi:PSD1 and planctomycete cytochrome C domain-containing protein [bacterium]|nr:PSD1 and planctomycete cytochrome C domain-containing protein [bacterium]
MTFLLFAITSCWVGGERSAEDRFEREIRPILVAHCQECHQSKGRSENGLALDRLDRAMRGGVTGPAIVPGKPSESLLMKAVEGRDGLEMPPEKPLASEQVKTLREWIADGAAWPSSADPAKGDSSPHWSFRPINRETPTSLTSQSAIDGFLDSRIDESGVIRAFPASRDRLLRRLSFDLIGLPPTPSEWVSFVSFDRPDKVERETDRLLASPRYAERWARHWLDLVRFAESNGFEYDMPKPNAYVYRDYVIESFNEDLPYHVFVTEHIAGDSIHPPRVSSDGLRILSSAATAGLWFQEMIELPMDWEVSRAEELENQIDVMGKAFLGLTLGCARCHDHKFDPVSAADYYSLAGVLMSSTNTQKCLDTQLRQIEIDALHERTVHLRGKIERIERQARESSEAQRLRRQEALRVKNYLLALRDIAMTEKREINFEQIALQHGVSKIKLQQWHREIMQDESVHTSLWLPWRSLVTTPQESFSYRKRAIGERLSANAARWPSRPLKLLSSVSTFEEDDWQGWTAKGEAFGDRPDGTLPFAASGFGGRRVASSYHLDNGRTGRLVSPRFKSSSGNAVACFRIAGGKDRDKTCVRVILNSESISVSEATITGEDSHRFRNVYIPMFFKDREVFFEVVDEASQGPWGHIMIDDFAIAEVPRLSEGVYRPTDLNALIMNPLFEPDIHTPKQVAEAYQAAILRVLDTLSMMMVKKDWSQSESKCVEWLSNNLLSHDEKELLTWVVRNDSLLQGRDELVEMLPAPDRERYRLLQEELRSIEGDGSRSKLGMVAMDFRPSDIAIHLRGDPHQPGKVVPRGTPSLFKATRPSSNPTDSGRMDLANWLISDASSLTARVLVNRVWQHHFGEGIVRTPDDFGSRGEPPTHPKLLDYLACDFIENGWSIKHLHRAIISTAAYQRDSVATAPSLEKDPDNRLFARFSGRRLDAECVVDSLGMVAETLSDQMYGPSDTLIGDTQPSVNTSSSIARRRTIYWNLRRNQIDPILLAFDFPIPVECTGKRTNQISPQQSLIFMNNSFVLAAAKGQGASLLDGVPEEEKRLEQLYIRSLSRKPLPRELVDSSSFLHQQKRLYEKLHEVDARRAAWQDLAHMVMSLPEFQFSP